jgi:hypothetical protein
MTFDFSQLELVDTFEHQVVDARGNDVVIDGVPFTITLASPGTTEAVKAQFKMDEARTARTLGSMAGTKSKRTYLDEIKETADFLMAITKATSIPSITYKGKTGFAAIEQMYLEPKLTYIPRNAMKAHKDEGNFAADSGTTSQNTSDTLPG